MTQFQKSPRYLKQIEEAKLKERTRLEASLTSQCLLVLPTNNPLRIRREGGSPAAAYPLHHHPHRHLQHSENGSSVASATDEMIRQHSMSSDSPPLIPVPTTTPLPRGSSFDSLVERAMLPMQQHGVYSPPHEQPLPQQSPTQDDRSPSVPDSSGSSSGSSSSNSDTATRQQSSIPGLDHRGQQGITGGGDYKPPRTMRPPTLLPSLSFQRLRTNHYGSPRSAGSRTARSEPVHAASDATPLAHTARALLSAREHEVFLPLQGLAPAITATKVEMPGGHAAESSTARTLSRSKQRASQSAARRTSSQKSRSRSSSDPSFSELVEGKGRMWAPQPEMPRHSTRSHTSVATHPNRIASTAARRPHTEHSSRPNDTDHLLTSRPLTNHVALRSRPPATQHVTVDAAPEPHPPVEAGTAPPPASSTQQRAVVAVTATEQHDAPPSASSSSLSLSSSPEPEYIAPGPGQQVYVLTDSLVPPVYHDALRPRDVEPAKEKMKRTRLAPTSEPPPARSAHPTLRYRWLRERDRLANAAAGTTRPMLPHSPTKSSLVVSKSSSNGGNGTGGDAHREKSTAELLTSIKSMLQEAGHQFEHKSKYESGDRSMTALIQFSHMDPTQRRQAISLLLQADQNRMKVQRPVSIRNLQNQRADQWLKR